MTDPVFFKPHNPDIPTHLWSSARWGTRAKWFHLVEFMLIEVLVIQFSHFVWSMGTHLPAIIMFTAMTLGCAAGTYFWWLHMRLIRGMRSLFDMNIGGHLISMYIPNELPYLEQQKSRAWRRTSTYLKGLSEAAIAYYDALSESPKELTPDSRVLESLAVVETILKQEATIRALTSSGTSDDEDKAIDRLNDLIDDAKDLILKETRRVREMFGKGAAAGIEQAIDFAVNGPSDKGTSTTKTGSLMAGDSQDLGAMEVDLAGEPSTGSDPDDLTLWGNDGGNVAHTFGTGFHGSCVQINQGDGAVQSMVIQDGRVMRASQTNKS